MESVNNNEVPVPFASLLLDNGRKVTIPLLRERVTVLKIILKNNYDVKLYNNLNINNHINKMSELSNDVNISSYIERFLLLDSKVMGYVHNFEEKKERSIENASGLPAQTSVTETTVTIMQPLLGNQEVQHPEHPLTKVIIEQVFKDNLLDPESEVEVKELCYFQNKKDICIRSLEIIKHQLTSGLSIVNEIKSGYIYRNWFRYMLLNPHSPFISRDISTDIRALLVLTEEYIENARNKDAEVFNNENEKEGTVADLMEVSEKYKTIVSNINKGRSGFYRYGLAIFITVCLIIVSYAVLQDFIRGVRTHNFTELWNKLFTLFLSFLKTYLWVNEPLIN